MTERLTAVEAAARLGVKRATLYAYVSRGLLDRTLSLDGRSSLFDAAQIEAMRANRRRPAPGELRTVITTSVTDVTEAGHRYRDTPVDELADTPFEDVADLLWGDDGPWPDPDQFQGPVEAAVDALPDSTPLTDRLRVAMAVASGLDPFRHSSAPSSMATAGRCMITAATFALPGPRPAADTERSGTTGVAARCAAALTSAAHVDLDAVERAVDLTLVLLADHGLAASTFSARIAASVRADPYSIVGAGLGPLGGRLHGAASRGVHDLFLAAERDGVDTAVGDRLSAGGGLPGVGHAVYLERDPRQVLLTERISEIWGDDARWPLVRAVDEAVRANAEGVVNIDFALGTLTWLMGAPVWAGEALFAVARIAGWVAHGIEESAEPAMRFRPSARYVTPPTPDTLDVP